MARNEKRTLNIRALMVDELSGQLSDIRRQIAKSAEATKKANEKAAKSWRALKIAAGAALAVYGAIRSIRFTRAFTDQVDQIGKLAQALGRPVEEVSELSAAFVRAGGNAEQFRAVFASVLSSVNGAISGSKAQAEAFKTLGITVTELRRLNPTQVLAELASGTDRVISNNEKLRQFAILFPEQYKNVLNLVGQGRQAFDQTLERVRRVGATVTQEQVNAAAKLNDAWADLEDSLASIGREFLTAFGPEATAALNSLAEFVSDNKQAFVDFALVIKNVVVASISLMADAIIGLIGLIESIPGVDLSGVEELEQKRLDYLDSIRQFPGGFGMAVNNEQRAAFIRAVARLPGKGEIQEQYQEFARVLDQFDSQIAERRNRTLAQRLSETRAAFEKETSVIIEGIRRANQGIKQAAEKAGDELRFQWDPIDFLMESGGEKLPTEPSEAARQALRAQGEAAAVEWGKGVSDSVGIIRDKVGGSLAKTFEGVLPTLKRTVDGIKRAVEDLVTGPTNFQSFLTGFSEGVKRLTREAKDFYKSLGEGLGRLTSDTIGAFSSSLADVISGARTAKEAWNDFLQTTLNLVSRRIARLVTLKLVGSVAQATGIQLAQGGVLSGVDRGQSVPMKAYRDGGVARRPQLALFGEGNRAEAFVPLPDNRSIPVTFTGNNGPSGTGAVVNLNVYAWDSKDAARGLLEQQETIRSIFQTGAETRNGLRQTIQRAAR